MGFYLGFPLTAVLFMFSVYVTIHGRGKGELVGYYMEGFSKALIVARMLILIGINTSLWLSSGCIAGIIHYGAQFILPNFFLPICFLLCAGLSFMLGSAFATTATMGIITYQSAQPTQAYLQLRTSLPSSPGPSLLPEESSATSALSSLPPAALTWQLSLTPSPAALIWHLLEPATRL